MHQEVLAQFSVNQKSNARIENLILEQFKELNLQNYKVSINNIKLLLGEKNNDSDQKQNDFKDYKHSDPTKLKDHKDLKDNKHGELNKDLLKDSFLKYKDRSSEQKQLNASINGLLDYVKTDGILTQSSLTGEILLEIDDASLPDLVSKSKIYTIDTEDYHATLASQIGFMAKTSDYLVESAGLNEIARASAITQNIPLKLIMSYFFEPFKSNPAAYANPLLSTQAISVIEKSFEEFPELIEDCRMTHIDSVFNAENSKLKLYENLISQDLVFALLQFYSGAFNQVIAITKQHATIENDAVNTLVKSSYPNLTPLDIRINPSDYKELSMPDLKVTGGQYSYPRMEDIKVSNEAAVIAHAKAELEAQLHHWAYGIVRNVAAAPPSYIITGQREITVTGTAVNSTYSQFITRGFAFSSAFAVMQYLNLGTNTFSYTGLYHNVALTNQTWYVDVKFHFNKPPVGLSNDLSIGTITKKIVGNQTLPCTFSPSIYFENYKNCALVILNELFQIHRKRSIAQLVNDDLTNPLKNTFTKLDAFRSLIIAFGLVKGINAEQYKKLTNLYSSADIKQHYFKYSTSDSNTLTPMPYETLKIQKLFVDVESIFRTNPGTGIFQHDVFNNCLKLTKCKSILFSRDNKKLDDKVQKYKDLLKKYCEFLKDDFNYFWIPWLNKLPSRIKETKYFKNANELYKKSLTLLSKLEKSFNPDELSELRESCKSMHAEFKKLSKLLSQNKDVPTDERYDISDEALSFIFNPESYEVFSQNRRSI